MICALVPVDARHVRLGLGFLGLGLAALAIAWGFPLIGGYVPCKLCLEQREPYYVALPVVALASLGAFRGGLACPVRGAFVVAGLLMLYGATTGIYQAGAEWGWWLGPNDCGVTDAGGTTNVGDLMTQLQTVRLVSCSDASGRFLGLSFAGWNVLASGGLALIALAAAVLPAQGSSSASQ